MGVSISPLRPNVPFTGGGAGRAKGLGGPLAPALRRALALGEGGGKTTPVWPPSRTGVICAPVCACGEEPAVRSSPESSEGICTFSRGLRGSACMLFVLLGGTGP